MAGHANIATAGCMITSLEVIFFLSLLLLLACCFMLFVMTTGHFSFDDDDNFMLSAALAGISASLSTSTAFCGAPPNWSSEGGC
jgi:hypothetical protein